jgi:hypothetical protein
MAEQTVGVMAETMGVYSAVLMAVETVAVRVVQKGLC